VSRYYFDSSVFLAPMLQNIAGGGVVRATDFLRRASGGEVEALASALTWDEVVWSAAKARAGAPFDGRRATQVGRLLLAAPRIRWLPVDVESLTDATSFLVDAKPRDALHLAATRSTAATLVTADGNLARVARSHGLASIDLLDGLRA